MLKKSILASPALAAIVFATPVSAQTTPPADDQPKAENDQSAPPDSGSDIVFADYRMPEDIIVSTGVPQYSSNVGQAVTLIKRDTIERRQTVALTDLLATTPGVTVSRNGGLGGFAAVRIRGAEGEQTLTLIDGVRVNDPSSPGGDFANLLAGSIDQVEILRGANSVPWGSQAIGGVINITTAKNPDYGNSVTTRGNLEYGGFDSVFANAGVSAKRGSVSGSFDAGYLKTDGISAAPNATAIVNLARPGASRSASPTRSASTYAAIMPTARSISTASRHPPSRWPTRPNMPGRRSCTAMPR